VEKPDMSVWRVSSEQQRTHSPFDSLIILSRQCSWMRFCKKKNRSHYLVAIDEVVEVIIVLLVQDVRHNHTVIHILVHLRNAAPTMLCMVPSVQKGAFAQSLLLRTIVLPFSFCLLIVVTSC
jgi:hypothetical protein